MNKNLKRAAAIVLFIVIGILLICLYKKLYDRGRFDSYIMSHLSFVISTILSFVTILYSLDSVSKISIKLEFGETRAEIFKDIYIRGLLVVLIALLLCVVDIITNYLFLDNEYGSSHFKVPVLVEVIQSFYLSFVIFFSFFSSLYSSVIDRLLYLIIITAINIGLIIICFSNNLLVLVIACVALLLINVIIYIKNKKIIYKRLF